MVRSSRTQKEKGRRAEVDHQPQKVMLELMAYVRILSLWVNCHFLGSRERQLGRSLFNPPQHLAQQLGTQAVLNSDGWWIEHRADFFREMGRGRDIAIKVSLVVSFPEAAGKEVLPPPPPLPPQRSLWPLLPNWCQLHDPTTSSFLASSPLA